MDLEIGEEHLRLATTPSCQYWTLERLERLERVHSFEEAAELALEIIREMPAPRCQVCGPISTGGLGSIAANSVAFRFAVDLLRAQGENPFDQMPFEGVFVRLVKEWQAAGGTGYCMPILEVFYRRIFESGLIGKMIFLPGWESSYGAKWERDHGLKAGLEIVDMADEAWQEVLREMSNLA